MSKYKDLKDGDYLYLVQQTVEQPTFSVGTDLSDGKLSVVVMKHENGTTWVIHSEVIQLAEQQPDILIGRTVSMDVSTGDHDACHRLFGTVIGVEGRDGVILCELQEDNHDVEQQPDIAQLVEALSIARDYVFSSLEEKKLALAGYPQMWRCEQDDLAMIDATLSAYRKEDNHDQ